MKISRRIQLLKQIYKKKANKRKINQKSIKINFEWF